MTFPHFEQYTAYPPKCSLAVQGQRHRTSCSATGQYAGRLCRRKMRMSGLCKVEMSAFMDGRGAYGNGADRLEPRIERRLDGSHWLRYRGSYLHLRPCPEPMRPSASPSGLRPPRLAAQKPKPKNKIKTKTKYHVPADHPWRRPWKRTFLCGKEPDISTLR